MRLDVEFLLSFGHRGKPGVGMTCVGHDAVRRNATILTGDPHHIACLVMASGADVALVAL